MEKRSRGRPKMDKNIVKNREIKVRLNETEYEEFMDICERLKCSKSRAFRSLIHYSNVYMKEDDFLL